MLRTFHVIITLHLCKYVTVHYIYVSMFHPTTKATGYEILLYVLLYSARSWYISQEKQVGYELL